MSLFHYQQGDSFWDDPVGEILANKTPKFDANSTQLGNISSSEWQEAANMMYPAQQQLINYAENPNYINQQRAQGISDADQSFSAQQSDQTRQMGLMGVNPTSAQSSAISKSQALGKAESEAAAGNAAAQGAYQNQQAAFRGLN